MQVIKNCSWCCESYEAKLHLNSKRTELGSVRDFPFCYYYIGASIVLWVILSALEGEFPGDFAGYYVFFAINVARCTDTYTHRFERRYVLYDSSQKNSTTASGHSGGASDAADNPRWVRGYECCYLQAMLFCIL